MPGSAVVAIDRNARAAGRRAVSRFRSLRLAPSLTRARRLAFPTTLPDALHVVGRIMTGNSRHHTTGVRRQALSGSEPGRAHNADHRWRTRRAHLVAELVARPGADLFQDRSEARNTSNQELAVHYAGALPCPNTELTDRAVHAVVLHFALIRRAERRIGSAYRTRSDSRPTPCTPRHSRQSGRPVCRTLAGPGRRSPDRIAPLQLRTSEHPRSITLSGLTARQRCRRSKMAPPLSCSSTCRRRQRPGSTRTRTHKAPTPGSRNRDRQCSGSDFRTPSPSAEARPGRDRVATVRL